MNPPVFKLGMKAFTSPKLKMATYFKAPDLPTPPVRFGRPWLVQNWGMLANDQAGDCVFAGAAHETMLYCADAGNSAVFSDESVLSDYSAVTGYDPRDEKTDQGTDPEAAAAYRRKTGIADKNGNRHKVDVYADMRVGDVEQLALAVYLFGAVGVGVSLPQSAMDAFNHGDVWSLVGTDNILGGHYVPCVGRNSAGNFLFVTWGRLQAATPAWVRRYMTGGIAYMSRERLSRTGLSPQGYDASALNDDFSQVTA